MACLQLYMKDSDAFPGESAAASIVSRSLNGQGGISLKCLETMVCHLFLGLFPNNLLLYMHLFLIYFLFSLVMLFYVRTL